METGVQGVIVETEIGPEVPIRNETQTAAAPSTGTPLQDWHFAKKEEGEWDEDDEERPHRSRLHALMSGLLHGLQVFVLMAAKHSLGLPMKCGLLASLYLAREMLDSLAVWHLRHDHHDGR